MDAWELDDLEAARVASGRLYHEFISVPDLSGGLYVLEAGATDPQSPHAEDELYVVMAGRAKVAVGGRRPRDQGRFGDLRRGRGRAQVPRHRGAARAARDVRPGGVLARGLSRAAARQLQRELGTTAGLVVAEEDIRVVASREEWIDSVAPGRSSSGV